MYQADLGFGVPEDWFPEEESDIQATKVFIRLVKGLLSKGESVDCIDAWDGESDMPYSEVPVNLNNVREDEFRFFENYHFDFSVNP